MLKKRYYVGLSCSGHDPAIAIVNSNGQVIFAEATERFLQDKRAWGAAPDHYSYINSILSKYCVPNSEYILARSWLNSKLSDDELAPYRQIENSGRDYPPPLDRVNSDWSRNMQRGVYFLSGINLKHILGDKLVGDILGFDHHLCHAMYACADSSFQDAKCLIMDGEGERGAVSVFQMKGRILEKRLWRSYGMGSVGAYYAWLTQKCGFSWRDGEEWKVMGLAALGEVRPEIVRQLRKLVIFENGKPLFASPEVWLEVENVISPFFRNREQSIESAADLAASGQMVFGEFVDSSIEQLGLDDKQNLVYSGGCALNSLYNGSIIKRHSLSSIHVPSAPGDDGNAIGAALLAWAADNSDKPIPSYPIGAYLGSAPSIKKIQVLCSQNSFSKVTELAAGSTSEVAALLKSGKIIGIMQGRAEFGPRSLGNRSILACPAIEGMKDKINLKVKGREAYRPFAPVIKQQHVSEWFAYEAISPYMSFAIPWKEEKAKLVPAVVHFDCTGRLQTVREDTHPWLYNLLDNLELLGLPPILLNTSFNIMGKPIVHDIKDAIAVLLTSGLDAVLLENILIEK